MPNTQDPSKLSLSGDFSAVSGGASAKPDADFSGVTGGSSAVAGAGGSQSYTVASGDTLSHIAKRFYGDAGQWKKIFEANKDQLDDPDRIFPGQTLRIP